MDLLRSHDARQDGQGAQQVIVDALQQVEQKLATALSDDPEKEAVVIRALDELLREAAAPGLKASQETEWEEPWIHVWGLVGDREQQLVERLNALGERANQRASRYCRLVWEEQQKSLSLRKKPLALLITVIEQGTQGIPGTSTFECRGCGQRAIITTFADTSRISEMAATAFASGANQADAFVTALDMGWGSWVPHLRLGDRIGDTMIEDHHYCSPCLKTIRRACGQ